MDRIDLPDRASEEVSAPPPTPARSSRFAGFAVLAAIAAAVLGISALGSPATSSGVAYLANGSVVPAAGPAASPGTAPAGSAEGATPAGGHNAGGQQAGAEGAAAADPNQQLPAVDHTVTMAGKMFAPQVLNIAVGDTVTWVNDDDVAHTVTVVNGPETFASELMQPGTTFVHTFSMPGEYSYVCDVHPDMQASVLVTGVGVPPVEGEVPPGGGQLPVDESGCVPSAASDALMRHIEAAHLQTSPGQQVKDLADLDEYIKLHTVLVQNMAQPVLDGVVTDGLASSLDTLRRHVETAHLQTSPGQQVADLLALDEYVKLHTVLVQNMLAPNLDYTAC